MWTKEVFWVNLRHVVIDNFFMPCNVGCFLKWFQMKLKCGKNELQHCAALSGHLMSLLVFSRISSFPAVKWNTFSVAVMRARESESDQIHSCTLLNPFLRFWLNSYKTFPADEETELLLVPFPLHLSRVSMNFAWSGSVQIKRILFFYYFLFSTISEYTWNAKKRWAAILSALGNTYIF